MKPTPITQINSTNPSALDTPTINGLAARLDKAETRYQKSEKRFRVLCGTLLGTIAVTISLPFVSPAVAQGYGMTLAQAATRIAALETKTASIGVLTDPATNKPTVRFSGVNVQIVDGTGSTEGTQSGLGNLIVGYNELNFGNGYPNTRTDNHNLIAGIYNNYSGNGGVVFGYQNTISSVEATVTGGALNTASTNQATVSGGRENTASGLQSCVSGGRQNVASDDQASVSGGYLNRASGGYTSVSGGYNNVASKSVTSVSGGANNTASGNYSSVSGGYDNTARELYSSVSGGYGNTASGDYSSVAGGQYVAQLYLYGFSAGGTYFSISSGQGTFHSP